MEAPTKALGYVRVSTDDQFSSGAGLAAQKSSIQAEADRRGWDLEIIGETSGSSSATLERDGLQSAMRRLDRKDADVLIVAKLDRLSRSVIQGAEVMARAQRKGWKVVALDLGIDTTTPVGEMMGTMVLSMAQYERRLIGERTKAALAQKKLDGIILGRPQTLTDETVTQIIRLRFAGLSIAKIAAHMTAENVPTARGGLVWSPATIQKVLISQAARRLAGTSPAR